MSFVTKRGYKTLRRNVNRCKDYRGPADGDLTWPKHVAAIIIATLNSCMVELYLVHYEFCLHWTAKSLSSRTYITAPSYKKRRLNRLQPLS